MYKIVKEKNSINILWCNKSVLEGLHPVVCLDDGNEYDLLISKYTKADAEDDQGKYKFNVFVYESDDGVVSLSLEFKIYDDIILCCLFASLKFDGFSDIRALKPVGGIRLEVLGLGKIDGLMANHLFGVGWWMRPHFNKDITKLPSRTQSLLWKNNSGYQHITTVCDNIVKSEIYGSDSGINIQISAYSGGYTECHTTVFVLGACTDPYELCHKTVSFGFQSMKPAGEPRDKKKYPQIFEYLGWCSWDAFYYDVNSQGIISKFNEFRKLGLPVKWIILDAGWSSVNDNKLSSLTEDKSKFADGINGLIKKLKNDYDLKWFGVWQNFLGFWNGIDPDGDLSKEMSQYLFKSSGNRIIPFPDESKGFKFWNKWHSWLKQQGVDFVKVDNQSSLLNFTRNNIAVGRAAYGAHQALEASVGISFEGNMINCMGMASEELWNRPVSSISRNSDDFFPDKKNSFNEHALQNSYNSYYHSNFVWCDWDMWWTEHDHALNNAVLRAVSGGPIYISDQTGKTVPEILWPLILKDGRILRCDKPGIPAEDCLSRDPTEENIPLKIWNTFDGTGIIALFNINKNNQTVHGKVSPRDIPVLQSDRYAFYDFFKKTAIVSQKNTEFDVTLAVDEIVIFSIVPFVNGIAALGIIDKYISPATITSQYVVEGKRVIILKEGGRFGFMSDSMPRSVHVNGIKSKAFMEKGLYIIDCTYCTSEVLLEIELFGG